MHSPRSSPGTTVDVPSNQSATTVRISLADSSGREFEQASAVTQHLNTHLSSALDCIQRGRRRQPPSVNVYKSFSRNRTNFPSVAADYQAAV